MKNLMILALTLLMACGQKTTSENTNETAEEVGISLTKLWSSDTLLTTSESVLFDKENNVLYVSCIGGVPPDAQDEDGYIAKVSPTDGSIIERYWVTGIDAPKGMGLVGTTLYVTNIDEVVSINITTAEIISRLPVADAIFLNDISTDEKGNVYISDSYANKLHKLSAEGELTTWMSGESLGNPNGLFHDGNRMMLATIGAGTFHTINYSDNKMEMVVDSIPSGDGVVKVGMDFLVSNWNGEVYYVTSDWKKEKILDTKDMGANAADIEFDEASMTLFVPTFFGNQVVAYELKK